MTDKVTDTLNDINKERFLIKEASSMVGCSPMTLKVWEKNGLLKFKVYRDANDRRRYSKAQIAQLRAIWLARNPE